MRELRLQAGVSQAALAAAVGTSQSTLSRWERGRSRPTAGDLELLGKALELTPEQLAALVQVAEEPATWASPAEVRRVLDRANTLLGVVVRELAAIRP